MYYPGMVQAGPPSFVRLAAHEVRWRLLHELARGDLRVRELVTLLGLPQNLVSYHLRLLRSAGLVSARRSSHDGRDSYYHLDLDRCAQALADTGATLHPALRLAPAPPVVASDDSPPVMASGGSPPVSVLFVCTGNSARSLIAEALLRSRAGGRVETASAGTRPKPRLHPHTVGVLRREYGIDVSGRRPLGLDALAGRRFDHLITLCDRARETCPEIPGDARRAHWSIPDPAAADGAGQARYASFAGAAADIDTRIRHLLPVLSTANPMEAQP